ncbi:hypothetical protein BSKO_01077 [Bryopsis sp. KO-2023]|nr:hypothetical protein BSKO_01077 [Bryopsis sp. KO-2023]
MPTTKPLEEYQHDAYMHVLRAFQVQKSNDWSRQKLLINLRKTLKISNEQHLSTLNNVVNDSELKELSTGHFTSKEQVSEPPADVSVRPQGPSGNGQSHPQTPEPSRDTMHEKRQPKASPHPSKKSQDRSRGKSRQAHSSDGRTVNTNPSGLNAKGGGAVPSKKKIHNASSPSEGPAPNSTTSTLTPSMRPPNTHSIGPNSVNAFVGRRAESFWAESDPPWVKAVITDYSVETRKHCLTYDYNTHDETFEWVDLDSLLREGQVRLLAGPAVDLASLAMGGRKGIGHYQAGSSGKVLGKRTRFADEHGYANGGMDAPFDSNFLYHKLQHGSLEDLEEMLNSVMKRRKIVLDKLVESSDAEKIKDPLARAIVDLSRLERRAEELSKERASLAEKDVHDR